MKRLKILILSPALTAVSGVSTHANALLHSTLQQDHDLLHFQVGSEGRNETRVGKLFRLLATPVALAIFAGRHRPDILHLNSSMDHKAWWRDLGFLLVAKLMRIKVVNQIHGGELPLAFCGGNRALTWLLRRTLLASDAVAVLSMQERQAYSAFCPAAALAWIPNAVHQGNLPAARKCIPNRPLKLVYIGRLIREKGLFEVLDAMTIVRRAGHAVHLDIAGSGPAEADLRCRVMKLGLTMEVHFLGPVHGEAKTRLWEQSDLLAFPTYHPEGLPYALLEAMAGGTPAITCAVAAIPDVMQHGIHGLFVPPRDATQFAAAVAVLDNDRARLHNMANACQARIRAYFTTDRLAGDFRQLYRSLLREGA